MPRPSSRFSRYLAIALAIFFLPIFVFATTVAATGVVTVEVHEHGENGVDLYIPFPALFFDVAVWLAPKVISAEELADARQQVAPYRDGLEALAAELESCPPGVLVEVESPGEHVRIVKSWRSFDIDVKSADADVSVSVPARFLGRALDLVG